MPLITVVMPARNSEKTISPAIKSLLRSLPRDSEIVVWDDASSDATVAQAESAGRGKVRIMESEVSVGSGTARQRILMNSDSRFVAIMDADDLSLPWRFQVQLPLLRTHEFVLSSSLRFGAKKLRHPTLPLTYNSAEVRSSLAFHNTLTHSSLVAQRAALEGVGGYGDSRVAQDYDLWLRAASKVRFIRVGIPCVAYRMSPSQVSSQPDYHKRILGQRNIYDAYLRNLKDLVPATLWHAVVEDEANPSRSEIEQLLPGLLQTFRPALRLYYSQLLRQNPGGPFGGVGGP